MLNRAKYLQLLFFLNRRNNKLTPMSKKVQQDMLTWLRTKLAETESVIKESKLNHNYGKATQFEGKREAYLDCLRRLTNEQPMQTGSI